MKTLTLLVALLALAGAQSSLAQSDKYQRNIGVKIESIKVYGACVMDKQRIENAALTIGGVKSAVWDGNSQTLTIKYSIFNKNVTDNVQKKIASVGNDTEKYRAADAAYNALPECCHYRKTNEVSE